MKVEDTLKLKRFPTVVQSGCRNINRIHPLKQKQVDRIHHAAAKYPEIKRVYVFGSAATALCNVDSDLDICIDADMSDGLRIYEMQKEFGEACDWNCDMIMYGHLGARLKKTVDEQGVVIYE
ncbi:MAG: nucleotidyltransferase domain-containing protein [Lachnospiraceae bacterium]|nr:nucleotidyltransferase domain-containing protein [Lachnospiraceae bacterium]